VNGKISPTLVQGYKTRYLIKNSVVFPGTDAAAADSVRAGKFNDYYGRVNEFDPATNIIRSYIEGGPFSASANSQSTTAYPPIHFSNPDGLDFMTIGTKTYMIIQEDLNGMTYNRMPGNITKITCESYLLDMSIANPTFSNLVRFSACSPGAEITGATMAGSNVMLLNVQHPDLANTFPYNNSLTYAITGFNNMFTSNGELIINEKSESFNVFPNPTSREINLNKEMDAAIYNISGQRLKVVRDTKTINVSDLNPGVYFIQNTEGKTVKFIVE
jgi:hypothetical protein